jgi:hypothetical protein
MTKPKQRLGKEAVRRGLRIPRVIDLQGLFILAMVVALIVPVHWYWKVLIFLAVFIGAYVFLYGVPKSRKP